MTSFRNFSSESSQFNNSSSARTNQQLYKLERLWKASPAERTTERDLQAPSPSWHQRLGLQEIGQWLLNSLTGSQQLRIWTKHTKAGMQWCAYDSARDQSVSCNSEEELRTWLEQRHLG